jgi:hypothetical protein
MKANNFDFGMWLKNRAEKENIKSVEYSKLTRIERKEALLNLLGENVPDLSEVIIQSVETRNFADCSAAAKASVLAQRLNEAQALLRANETEKAMILLRQPSDYSPVNVVVRTSFLSATLKAQLEYLEAAVGTVPDTITMELPCGPNWVAGLKAYIVNEYLKEKEAKEAE